VAYKYNKIRLISNKELADLPSEWENSKVDTSKYYTCVMRAYQATKDTYEDFKKAGCLCQKHKGLYYIV